MANHDNPDERLASLRQRWDADRTSRVFLQLAEEYRRQGQPREATVVLEEGLTHHPTSIAGMVALGRARLESGEVEGAVAILEQVVARDPTQMVAYRTLVDCYIALEAPSDAEDRLEHYAQLNPQDPEIPQLETVIERLPRQAAQDSAPGEASDGQGSADVPPPDAGDPPAERDQSWLRAGGAPSALTVPTTDAEGEAGLDDTSERHTVAISVADLLAASIEEDDDGGADEPLAPADSEAYGDLRTPQTRNAWGFDLVGPNAPNDDTTDSNPVVEPLEPASVDSGSAQSEGTELTEPPAEPDLETLPDDDATAALATEPEENPEEEAGEEEASREEHEADSPVAGFSSPRPRAFALDELEESLADDDVVDSAEPELAEVFDGEPDEDADAPPLAAQAVEERDEIAEDSTGVVEDAPLIFTLSPGLVTMATPRLATLQARALALPNWARGGSYRDGNGSHPERETGETDGPKTAAHGAVATTTLGELYLRQGHPEEAARIYERVLEADPEDSAARDGLEAAKRQRAKLTARSLLGDGESEGESLKSRQADMLRRYLEVFRTSRDDVS